MRPLVLALLALTVLPFAPGCYLASQGRELEHQLTTLASRQNEFAATYANERDRLTELAARAERRVVELESALSAAQEFLQRNNADLGAEVESLRNAIHELRGQIEEARHQQSLLREEMQLLREEMDLRFSTAPAGR